MSSICTKWWKSQPWKTCSFISLVKEAVIGPTLSTRPSTFLFHELKELWWIDNSLDKYDIDAQLSFLKLCPSLEKLFITIDPRSYGTPSRSECQVK
ncbi:F-box protein [Vitis vinifera]|uniref:F-box protein n=1 Tax=Vitis vinifera TaxID=29760 RepID=A0A438JX88_VITVI|nr:F-box protein [Vitis vinifera]